MLNKLKYLPIALKIDDTYCTPAGPYFSTPKLVRCVMNGNTLSFFAPKHSTRTHRNPISPKKDALDFTFRDYPEDIMPDQSWRSMTCFYRSWSFWGPWFGGHKAELSMTVTVLEQAIKEMNASFFHPMVFESKLSTYLTALFWAQHT